MINTGPVIENVRTEMKLHCIFQWLLSDQYDAEVEDDTMVSFSGYLRDPDLSQQTNSYSLNKLSSYLGFPPFG